MNNAHCYAFETGIKYVMDSDEEEQYQFRDSNIIRTQKSMSLNSVKQAKRNKGNEHMKKSNSFLLQNSKLEKCGKIDVECKNKNKSSKKCLNITQSHKKPPINSKNSMNKTSLSIGSVSNKSTAKIKKRSVSRDFLMLDQEIYECDNIEEINEKLICGSTKLYSHERFLKLTMKNQERLEKYISGFVHFLRYAKKNPLNIKQMTKQQKTKLYHMLKLQANSLSHRSAHVEKDYSMDKIIKDAYNKIQKKTDEVMKQHPQEEKQIKKWKNVKLHQLMAIHSCLNEQEKSSERIYEIIKVESEFKLDFRKSQEVCVKERQQHLKSTSVGNKSEQFIPQQAAINSHIIEEKYPQAIKNNSNLNYQIIRYLPDEHYLSDLGIQSFLQDLWNYMVDQNYIEQFLINLKKSFGLSQEEKRFLFENSSNTGYEWSAYIAAKHKPILSNQIFIQFCKANNERESELTEQEHKCQLILHKAIFDALNIELTRFQFNFPFGPSQPMQKNMHRHEDSIDQENAMSVWEQCLSRIINSSGIGLGSLAFIDNEEIEKEVKAHNEKSFLKYFQSEQQLHIWDRTRGLAYRKTLQNIMKDIETELYLEISKLIIKF